MTAVTPETVDANPYLQGNYGPVDREVSADELPIEGTVPGELDGLLLRDGPNPFGPVPPSHHWFIGDGMVHGLRVRDGRAEWYRNRWVRTAGLEAKGGPAAVAPSPNRDRLLMHGSGAVNVVAQAGRILALGEAGFPFTLRGVETLGEEDFGGALPAGFTAHPKIDPVTGEMFGFGYDPGPTHLWSYVVDSFGALESAEPIDLPAMSMMHDMGLTETRVIYLDLPVVFDGARLEIPGAMPFSWQPEAGARIGVLPRGGDNASVAWLDIDPCYVFHVANAFDDGDRIVMDVVRYDAMFRATTVGPSEPSLGSLWRWTIDPESGTMASEQLSDERIEFPRIDERRVGRPHGSIWAVELSGSGFDSESVVRYGSDGTLAVRRQLDGLPGEALFVPRTAEGDDGYVVTVVYDPATDRSRVHFLDAMSLEDVGVVQLPVRVPFGFHGAWIPAGAAPID